MISHSVASVSDFGFVIAVKVHTTTVADIGIRCKVNLTPHSDIDSKLVGWQLNPGLNQVNTTWRCSNISDSDTSGDNSTAVETLCQLDAELLLSSSNMWLYAFCPNFLNRNLRHNLLVYKIRISCAVTVWVVLRLTLVGFICIQSTANNINVKVIINVAIFISIVRRVSTTSTYDGNTSFRTKSFEHKSISYDALMR